MDALIRKAGQILYLLDIRIRKLLYYRILRNHTSMIISIWIFLTVISLTVFWGLGYPAGKAIIYSIGLSFVFFILLILIGAYHEAKCLQANELNSCFHFTRSNMNGIFILDLGFSESDRENLNLVLNNLQPKNKIKAEEISRNRLVGETGTEIAKEFRVFQNLNARCLRNSFSFVLSPTVEDGDRLTKSDFIKISDQFLSQMNLSDNQSISFLHKDRRHVHLHIFVNRINAEGKTRKDNYIGKKAQRVAERIACEMNLTTARKVQQEKEIRLRRIIGRAHEKIWALKPDDIFEYAQLMEQNCISVHLKQASNGKVVGLKFQVRKESIKASSVHRALSAANLQKLIKQNRKTYRYRLKI